MLGKPSSIAVRHSMNLPAEDAKFPAAWAFSSSRPLFSMPRALLLFVMAATLGPGEIALGEGFSHQDYGARADISTFEILKAPPRAEINARQAMDGFAQLIRDRRIAKIWLVHGTFSGEDGFGVLSLAAERAPALLTLLGLDGDGLRKLSLALNNDRNGPDGFNPLFAEEFNRQLGTQDLVQAAFVWGSENNHLDRAHAAVCMIDALLKLELPAESTAMLWGHSHAGNVFALATQLLANDREANARFFEIGQPIYGEDPRWKNVQTILEAAAGPHALGKQLYIVTFGTPIRYAWNPAGYRELIHFVNHKPVDETDLETPAYRTKVLVGFDDIQKAKHGDWIQAFAIDGTDSLPLTESRRQVNAEMAELFGALPLMSSEEGVLANLAFWARRVAFFQRTWGIRLQSAGTTLLVDYGPDSAEMLGHAVYMQQAWLPFHVLQITRVLKRSDAEPPQP